MKSKILRIAVVFFVMALTFSLVTGCNGKKDEETAGPHIELDADGGKLPPIADEDLPTDEDAIFFADKVFLASVDYGLVSMRGDIDERGMFNIFNEEFKAGLNVEKDYIYFYMDIANYSDENFNLNTVFCDMVFGDKTAINIEKLLYIHPEDNTDSHILVKQTVVKSCYLFDITDAINDGFPNRPVIIRGGVVGSDEFECEIESFYIDYLAALRDM